MPGSNNAEGVYVYAEDDTAPNAAGMLNKLGASLTTVVAALKAAILDTGWVDLTPESGWTSTGAAVRRIGAVVYFKGSLTKPSTLANTSTGDRAFELPHAKFKPAESGRANAGGFGSANANGVFVVLDKTTLEIRAFIGGPPQNTVYLSGVSYVAA